MELSSEDRTVPVFIHAVTCAVRAFSKAFSFSQHFSIKRSEKTPHEHHFYLLTVFVYSKVTLNLARFFEFWEAGLWLLVEKSVGVRYDMLVQTRQKSKTVIMCCHVCSFTFSSWVKILKMSVTDTSRPLWESEAATWSLWTHQEPFQQAWRSGSCPGLWGGRVGGSQVRSCWPYLVLGRHKRQTCHHWIPLSVHEVDSSFLWFKREIKLFLFFTESELMKLRVFGWNIFICFLPHMSKALYLNTVKKKKKENATRLTFFSFKCSSFTKQDNYCRYTTQQNMMSPLASTHRRHCQLVTATILIFHNGWSQTFRTMHWTRGSIAPFFSQVD